MNRSTAQHCCQTGVTLIELVLVIIIISVASVVILGLFSQAARGWFVDEDKQIAAQLAQERAETVLVNRRRNGYASIAVGTVNDVLPAPYTTYTRSVTVTTVSGAPCPNPSCKQVVVSVSRGATVQSSITFQLVSY